MRVEGSRDEDGADNDVWHGRMIITHEVVLDGDNENVAKSAKNIAGVRAVAVNAINVYDILKYETVIITKAAVSKIEEVYA